MIRLHGENQALLRHIQKLFFEFANQHVGALDQGGYFVQKGIVVNRFHNAATRFAYLRRRCRQLPHNFGAAICKTGNHCAIAGQRGGVTVGIRQHHR